MQWHEVDVAFQGIRDRTAYEHGTPADIELHAWEMMSGRKQWAPLRGKHREAVGIYRATLQALREIRVRYIFRGVDVAALHSRYGSAVDPHGYVLAHLLERIEDYAAKRKHLDPVVVIADEIATHAQHQKEFANYQELGTRGYRSSNLAGIHSPIRFESSKTTAGLQAADFGVYLHHRRHTIVEKNEKGAAAVRGLCKLMDPITHHHLISRP